MRRSGSFCSAWPCAALKCLVGLSLRKGSGLDFAKLSFDADCLELVFSGFGAWLYCESAIRGRAGLSFGLQA